MLIPPGGIVKSSLWYNKNLMPNLWLIFTTGLIAGGFTCAAVQGGLLATIIAQQKNEDPKSVNIIPILSFLIAKLIAYTILGFFLGWLGSFFQFSLSMQATLLVFVAIFMIGTALSFLEIHPVFRFFIIQPPRILTRFVRRQTKSQHVFAPTLFGASTIFIPCGTTQAMMALAVASGSPIGGALVLSTFVIGTFPVFFLLGYSIEWLRDILRDRFAKVAAVVIFGMAVWNLNTALILSGSTFVPSRALRSVYCTVTFCDNNDITFVRPKTDVTIRIRPNGYILEDPVITAGERITLTLINDDAVNCAQAFTIPSLGIQEIVPLGTTKTVSFIAPTNQSELAFTCSMGMYGGIFTVVGGGT